MSESLFIIQRQWSERGLLLQREMLPLTQPIASFPEFTAEQRYTIGMLLTAAARSSESVLLLSAYGQLWDAEMVLRSALEATMKLLYLLESRSDFAIRHDEYATQLFELSLLKDHRKIEELLRTNSDRDAREWAPLRDRLLVEPQLSELRNRYDQGIRCTDRWSVTLAPGSRCAGDLDDLSPTDAPRPRFAAGAARGS